MDKIEREYGDIYVSIVPSEYLGYVRRISTAQGINFHLTGDFYNEWASETSGFNKWLNDDSWTLQFVRPNGDITNQLELSLDEYEKINRFFTKFMDGTL